MRTAAPIGARGLRDIVNKERRKAFRKRIRRAVRGPLVTAGFWLGDTLIARLSRPRVMALAHFFAAVTRTCDPRGRRVARANLRVLYGPRATPRRVRVLVRACYHTAALVALDSVWFGRDTRARVAAWTRMTSELRARAAANRPALLVAAHFGNWEMTLLMGGHMGLPLVAVVKQQWSELVTARMNRLRCLLGVRIVFAEGALRTLLRELRSGHVAGFLLDQDTAPEEGGVWVDFGGLPATVSNGVALLSRRTHAPVILAFPHCRKDGCYDFYGPETLHPEADETDAAFTQRIVDGLVHTIRRHPSQWMLMYKRWSEIPPGAPAARYPFYARPVQAPPSRHSPFPAAPASGKTEPATGDLS